MARRGEFLESAEVHGNLYGTSQGWIDDAPQRKARTSCSRSTGRAPLQVRKLIPDAIGIFILPPSPDALRKRLVARGQDSADVIERRLAAAREEIAHVSEFDYVIINQNFDVAVSDLVSIVRAQRLRVAAQLAATAI